ncbi:MAG: hypothetical protein Fur006_12830 [Coleofasciculaceae cyanobacterium]
MNLTALFAKTSLIGIVAVPMLSFTSIAQASGCWAIAQDWDGSVALRSQPRRNILNQIASIPNGTQLEVLGRHNDWLEVYAPNDRFGTNYRTGWVAQKETRRICSRDDRSWYPDSSLPPLPPLPSLSPRWEYDYTD